MRSKRAAYVATSLVLSAVYVSAVYQDPAWVLPGEAVPSDSIRLTALGTGTPSVYKEQVYRLMGTPSIFCKSCCKPIRCNRSRLLYARDHRRQCLSSCKCCSCGPQVSTSYLLQTGDRQSFLFDAGTGSIVNLYATNVDLNTVNKVNAVISIFAPECQGCECISRLILACR